MFISFFKKIKTCFSKKPSCGFHVNYIFFSFFLLSISFYSSFKTNTLFALYSAIQACLLTALFIFLYHIFKSKIIKKILTALAFLIIFLYTANFILLGLMDNNLLFAIKIFFSGGLKNVLITFRAVNLNFMIPLTLFLAILLFPLMGILFYNLTNTVCLKKPLLLKHKHLFYFSLSLLMTLLYIDLTCRHKEITCLSKNHHRLPFFSNIISVNRQKILLSGNLKSLKNENIILEELNHKILTLDHKPNIFIFIIEAFRKDFIAKDITSNIFTFKEENIQSDLSFSAANSTQTSWYSIFHSNYPIYWSIANKTVNHGSLPLHILKKLGYKINIFSSAELSYFHMDNLLFGKNNYLADKFNDFSSSSKDPSFRDSLTIKALKNEIAKNSNKNSNVFIIFLDSTHSEYSWPKNFKPRFLPFADKINYITLSQSKKDLNLIKNRYKNALNYIDYLFGEAVTALKNNNSYDDSIIVLTGDHGEEFFEEKSIFHASHLNEYQIKVPIIFKLLNKNEKCLKTISHIDIFPTILNELLPNENFDALFDGKSIFSKNSPPYIIAVNQNGSFTPNELLIISNQVTIHGKLLNTGKKTLFIVSDTKNISSQNIENEVKNALKALIKK